MNNTRKSLHRATAHKQRDRLQALLKAKPYMPRLDREAIAYAIGILDDLLSDHDSESLH